MIGWKHVTASQTSHSAPSLPTTTTAMSLVPSRFVVGLRPYTRIINTTTQPSLHAQRLLSTSASSHAQHSPQKPNLSSGLEDRLHRHHETKHIYDAQGNEVNPYKDGPSALDKAVHLFFFTEIIRGNVTVFVFMTPLFEK